MNRVKVPLEINEGRIHWRIAKPTTVGGVVSWCLLIGMVLGTVTGAYAFYQSSKDTTKNVALLEVEHLLLKAKVDSVESIMNTKLNTNRLILQQILRNTSTNGVETEKKISDWEKAEADSIALAEKQREERKEEILRKLKEKK